MTQDFPWTEKHRPSSLAELSLQKDVRKLFCSVAEGAPFPNMLLYGPPGSGKTTLALILARAVTGRENILEMNASSDREIAVIRGKVKTFANTKAAGRGIKIVVMDECDYLTADAQHCLRRVIEDTQPNCRFVFITNYLSRIIDPIKSRLSVVYVGANRVEENAARLEEIGRSEGILLGRDRYVGILSAVNNDMRKAIILLQTLRPAINEADLDLLIEEATGAVPDSVVERFLALRNKECVLEFVSSFVRSGHSFHRLVQDLSGSGAGYKETTWARAALVLSKYEANILSGSTDEIGLLGMGMEMMDVLNGGDSGQT
jgi:replication factor C subunit 2/4